MARRYSEYRFVIDAYSPEDIPMARLAEYMRDLAALLGEPNSVHFLKLETDTAAPVGNPVESGVPGFIIRENNGMALMLRIEHEAIYKVNHRLQSISKGKMTGDAGKAFKALDLRLAEDKAIGRLETVEPETDAQGVIIKFPGRNRPKVIDYGAIRQAGAIEGILASIGEDDKTVHVSLRDGSRSYTNVNVTREMAHSLTPHLLGPTLRLHGQGQWQRDDEGVWLLRHFKAERFEVLDDTRLQDTVDSLRAIEGSGWPGTDNPLEYLDRLRHGENQGANVRRVSDLPLPPG